MSGGMTEEREVPEEAAAASVQGTATERPTAAPEEAPAAEAKAAIETAAAPPEEPEDDGSMSLIAHLTELRARLIKCLIAVAIGSCVGYYFLDEIMHYLTLPAGKLYYMQPSEAFFTYLKVAIAAGFLLALPVIFYQVWRFFLPALTRADIGIAIGAGTDVAIDAADVVLVNSHLSDVPAAIRLSRATLRNIHENLFWAFFSNTIGIPIAAGVLYPFTGWLLSPMIAGLAMALSSVCLVLNANRMRRVTLSPDTVSFTAAGGRDADRRAPDQHGARSIILDTGDRPRADGHHTDEGHHHQPNKEQPMHMNHMHSADMNDATQTATDPVCGMTVAVNNDAITREHDGTTYYFCGEHCANNFMKAPQLFLEN